MKYEIDLTPGRLARQTADCIQWVVLALILIAIEHSTVTGMKVAAAGDLNTEVEQQRGAQTSLYQEPSVIIYSGEYPGWPWVTKDSEGVLYCVFREGERHGFSSRGRIMLSVSRDSGKTWASAKTIIDKPGIDDRNTAITALKDGTLFLSFNEYTKDQKSQAYSVISQDRGVTWSTPTPMGPEETRTRAAAVELSDGSLLAPLYCPSTNDGRCIAARSIDRGKHWNIADLPNADSFVGDEWDVTEVAPGRLVGLSRNRFREKKSYLWAIESSDFGKSWGIPRRTNLHTGTTPAPAKITVFCGKPLVIYPNQRFVSVSAVTTSDPEYLKWDINAPSGGYRYYSNGAAIHDGSYVSPVFLSANQLLIVDYEIRDDSKAITARILTIPDCKERGVK
tara:strand:+ start:683 stop:1861 length:1179 start_codon:yes stop_codon:yes gene_type:complete